ncbi:MAG TPA: hypothetical protein VEJ18_10560 [Planctomycetota bacterium]|nr:hypothetical protein [Planctomycetota bacterium]
MSNYNELYRNYGIPSLPCGTFFDKVLWVSSVFGGADNDGQGPDRPLATIGGVKGAWAKAVSGAAQKDTTHGTLVIVMKGHTESISAADYGSDLGSKKRVYTVGQGEGDERGLLTWTAATSTLLLDTDNLVLDNLRLALEPGTGTVTVAAPITMSGNSCGLRRCQIDAGTDANNLVTVGITVTGDRCFMEDVDLKSATAAEATTFIRLTGADRFRMDRCIIEGATTSTTVGVVQFLTTASVNCRFRNSTFKNFKASSVHAVTGLAASSGYMIECNFGILDDATLAGFVTPANFQSYRCKTSNITGEAGGETSTVSA